MSPLRARAVALAEELREISGATQENATAQRERSPGNFPEPVAWNKGWGKYGKT
jgi:hypothetical protein